MQPAVGEIYKEIATVMEETFGRGNFHTFWDLSYFGES